MADHASSSTSAEHIHWYPGHIAKAEKKLKEQLSLVDAVIEVRDARLPVSSAYKNINSLLNGKPRLILLNKSDLTPSGELKKWTAQIEEQESFPTLACTSKGDLNMVIKKAVELARPRIDALMAKGLLRRPARVMVVGMPNVGKSSIINKLTRSSKTKTGAKAGVTRQQQWVRINPSLELLDTPGIIPMKQEDQMRAVKLAFVNSVSENAYSAEAAARELLKILPAAAVQEYYGAEDIENIALARNWLRSAREPDIARAAALILRDFREGRIGKFIID